MACTTILVGKKASYDGSTMIARNDDSPSGAYMPKKFVVIHPEDQPKVYESVISHVKIELPENPMRYTAMPNAVKGEGIWAASGVNEAQVERGVLNPNHQKSRAHRLKMAALRYCQSYLYSLLAYRPQCCNK